MTAEDYVDVKLSAGGEALAGATPELAPGETFAGERGTPCVRISGGGYDYCFEPGKAQRITAVEFRARLASAAHQGKAIFEIAPPGKSSRTARPSDAAERS
jgi:hypothetical protein